jgi:hypothetical protein
MAGHGLVGQHTPSRELAKERLFRRLLETRRCDIGIQIVNDLVMGRHHIQLAPLFVQAQLLLFALREVIFEFHPHHGADAGAAKDQHSDQPSVA